MTITSPCRQICVLGGDGHCDGCGRTLDEIARWTLLTPADRTAIQHRVAAWKPREAGTAATRRVTKPSEPPR